MAEPVTIDRLAESLDAGSREHIALVGGGGKTTALFALGRQLAGTVVLTTTTKMGRDRTGGRPVLFAPRQGELIATLDRSRVVLAWGADGGHKAVGVEPATCDRWFGLADHVIVEADGSHQRPFKAPRRFEPVVPESATMVIACVGASALGRVIADQCQRPMRVAAVAGCSPYERLTPSRLAKVLSSDRGSRKACPRAARYAVMINQVTERDHGFVEELEGLIGGETRLVTIAPFTSAEAPDAPDAGVLP